MTKNVKNKEAYDKLSKEQIKKGKKPKKYTITLIRYRCLLYMFIYSWNTVK